MRRDVSPNSLAVRDELTAIPKSSGNIGTRDKMISLRSTIKIFRSETHGLDGRDVPSANTHLR